MTENIYPKTDPQLQALLQVMQEITSYKVPLLQSHELAARSTLRALQWQIDDSNALDDSELIDVLNQARVEIKYLCNIITDFKQRIANRDSEIKALEYLDKIKEKEIREQIATLTENAAEIQRLENLVHRAN